MKSRFFASKDENSSAANGRVTAVKIHTRQLDMMYVELDGAESEKVSLSLSTFLATNNFNFAR